MDERPPADPRSRCRSLKEVGTTTARDSLPVHALTEDNLAAVSPDLRARIKALADALMSPEANALAVRGPNRRVSGAGGEADSRCGWCVMQQRASEWPGVWARAVASAYGAGERRADPTPSGRAPLRPTQTIPGQEPDVPRIGTVRTQVPHGAGNIRRRQDVATLVSVWAGGAAAPAAFRRHPQRQRAPLRRRVPAAAVAGTPACRRPRLGREGSSQSKPVRRRGEARQLLRPPVNQDPPTFITTDRHGDPVQPTLLDGLPAILHHRQYTILIVDTLHQFVHDTHPGGVH